MKTAIIVDSTAYLNNELASHPDVYVIPLTVQFSDGSTLIDTSDAEEQSAFYRKLQEQTHLPTTSQPQPGAYYELIEHLVTQGYDSVYCIHLSSGISGTYQTARMITSEYADKINVYCVDSKATSIVMEYMVQQILSDLTEGLDREQIFNRLLWIRDNAHVYLMVEDLNNLVKGGRLSATSAFLGGILKIRPLLHFDEAGSITLFEKIRTTKKVYRRFEELIEEALEQYPSGICVAFAHGDAYEEMMDLQGDLQSKFPHLKFNISHLGPVIGTHTGKGIKGMGIIPVCPL